MVTGAVSEQHTHIYPPPPTLATCLPLDSGLPQTPAPWPPVPWPGLWGSPIYPEASVELMLLDASSLMLLDASSLMLLDASSLMLLDASSLMLLDASST